LNTYLQLVISFFYGVFGDFLIFFSKMMLAYPSAISTTLNNDSASSVVAICFETRNYANELKQGTSAHEKFDV
jgi:hypothetical protein